LKITIFIAIKNLKVNNDVIMTNSVPELIWMTKWQFSLQKQENRKNMAEIFANVSFLLYLCDLYLNAHMWMRE